MYSNFSSGSDWMLFTVLDQLLRATFWGTQVLCWNPGVSSPHTSLGNRRTKLIICQINHQICCKEEYFFIPFWTGCSQTHSLTETCVAMALILWMSRNSSVYVSSGSQRLEHHKSPPWLSPDNYVMYKLRFVTICELSLSLVYFFLVSSHADFLYFALLVILFWLVMFSYMFMILCHKC